MAGPTTEHLAEDLTGLHDELRSLAASVNNLRTDFTGFRASTETQLKLILGIGRWVAAGFIGSVVTFGLSAGGVIWAASALNSKVEQQGVRLEKVEQGLDKVDQRLDQIERRFDRVDAQLAAVLQRFDRAKATP